MDEGKVAALLQRVARQRRMPPPTARRLLREQARLSQRDVAAVLGVSAVAVSHWERGTRQPRPEHHAAYQALLDKLASVA